MASSEPRRQKYNILRRSEIEGRIAEGQKIFILNGDVIRADAWIKYHPGGDKAILHMIGRDATDEVSALHSPEARERMRSFIIGKIEGRWDNFLPPIQGGKFRSSTWDIQNSGDQVDEDTLQKNSSAESSAQPSPIFEAVEHVSSGLKERKGQRSTASSSATSLSSFDLGDSATLPMSHLDSRTKEEIELDISKYPSLDSATQDQIVSKYRLLNERIKAEGLYDCPYSAYGIESIRYVFLFGMFLFLLQKGWYIISGVFLGMFWHQLVFTAHDAGHMGITHDFTVDTVIGIIISDFLGGLSLGWWKRNHNVHHIVTNAPEHDPDIEHMPFFAISHRFLTSLRSTYYDRIMPYDALAKFTIRYQHYLYYPLLLFGRFNLYRLSWEYLLLGLGPKKGPAWWHRWFEIAGNLTFWAWFGYGVVYRSIPTASARLAFVLASHMVTAPLHVQITLSHFAMSTADLGAAESFPQKMLRTTMDVDCPAWLDFFHGGLQFQAIHHLFPRIPRHNLRRTQKLVQAFCEDVGIPYALYGFADGNRKVIGRLEEVGRQAAILAACQREMARRPGLAH